LQSVPLPVYSEWLISSKKFIIDCDSPKSVSDKPDIFLPH